jgi:ribosomal protein S18 acetylase RimI-like enzyme
VFPAGPTDGGAGDGIRLRTATPADLPALQRVYRAAALSNAGERERLLADPETFLTFRGEHLAAGHTLLAEPAAGPHDAADADPEGEPVGFGTVLPPGPAGEPAEAELEDLFTDPARHRRGIGRRLVAALAARAREQGAERLAVTGNPHALDFYRAAGFVVVGEAPTLLGPAPRLHLPL